MSITTDTTTQQAPAAAPTTFADLQAQHTELLRQNEELHAERAAAASTADTRVTDARHEAVAEYKKRVKDVALRYAREHNLCSVVNDALDDLDIQTKREVTVDVLLRVRLTAETFSDESDMESFVHRSLSVESNLYDSRIEVALDEDWENQSFTSTEVESVEVVETD